MERGLQNPTKSGLARTANARKRRAELVAQGKIKLGRPKGVLNPKTIARIKSKEAFDKAITERAGQLADDLLRNSLNGDTAATKVALEQTFGKPKDNSLKDTINAAFSLLELARRAANLAPLDGNADIVTDALPALIEPHPRPSSSN